MVDNHKTTYAKDQEEKHKRKIILPCVIPWEYGSNKYASQKGQAAFGTIRNLKLNVQSSKPLSESNDGVVPQITCPPLHHKFANQSGQSFGNFREQVTKVIDKDGIEKVAICKIVDDKMTETMLKKWDKPNKNANNSDIGKRRKEVVETQGGRRFTADELNKCRAAIPRFQDPRMTVAAMNSKTGDNFQGGLHRHRQATTVVEGLNRTEFDQMDSNRYMAWLGGQLTLQSQSHTGGFAKPRDVVSTSYYDRLMSDRQVDVESIRKRLEEEKAKQDKEEGDDENKEQEPVQEPDPYSYSN
ncbi:unnamed protein product [Auanema sp. JU1783]|nr:unnamed protein product [Auanema sp. JU1783]